MWFVADSLGAADSQVRVHQRDADSAQRAHSVSKVKRRSIGVIPSVGVVSVVSHSVSTMLVANFTDYGLCTVDGVSAAVKPRCGAYRLPCPRCQVSEAQVVLVLLSRPG